MTADYHAAVQDHLVDLLHVDGSLAALIEMAPGADHLLVVNVAVAPACQGQGFGRVLLAHAEAVATSLGSAGSATGWSARRCIRSSAWPCI